MAATMSCGEVSPPRPQGVLLVRMRLAGSKRLGTSSENRWAASGSKGHAVCQAARAFSADRWI